MSVLNGCVSLCRATLLCCLGEGALRAGGQLVSHFTAHANRLEEALKASQEDVWKTVEIAILGETFWKKIGKSFQNADQRTAVQELSAQLAAHLETMPAIARLDLVREIKSARDGKRLTPDQLDMPVLLEHAEHGEPLAENCSAGELIPELQQEFPQLTLLGMSLCKSGRPFLLEHARSFFLARVFRDEHLKTAIELNHIETETQRHQELVILFEDHVSVISTEVGELLITQAETFETAQLMDGKLDEMLSLMQNLQHDLTPADSFTMSNPQERQALKDVKALLRENYPEEEDRIEFLFQLPTLLEKLARADFLAGNHADAANQFQALAEIAEEKNNPEEEARQHYAAHLALLSEKDFPAAFTEIQKAWKLCPHIYAPFPLERYQPTKILGAGGFGTVYHATNPQITTMERVIKSLRLEQACRTADEIFQEVIALQNLQHPHIIQIYWCGCTEDSKRTPYIEMEHFAGVSLETFLRENGTLSWEELQPLAIKILEGMIACHAAGILHRDLKPDNILVIRQGTDWTIKIIDFGLALAEDVLQQSQVSRGATRSIIGETAAGTINYAPPEQMGQLRNDYGNPRQVPPGPYSDIYAFAKTLCRALSGQTTLGKKVRKNVPPEIYELLQDCIEHDPEDRPQSMQEVLDVLTQTETTEQPAKPEATLDIQIKQPTPEIEISAQTQQQTQQSSEKIQAQQQLITPSPLLNQPAREPDPSHLLKAPLIAPFDTETARLAQQRWAKSLGREVVEENSIGMKLTVIPPGEFLMGSPTSEPLRSSNEHQHKVRITQSFLMGTYPVTQQEWEHVIGTAPSHFHRGITNEDTSRFPVEQVNWEECMEFCQVLTEREYNLGKLQSGWKYTLPTEAQWEYSCRAGTITAFHIGNRFDSNMANFDGNYPYGDGLKGKYLRRTSSVGEYPSNAFGLFDMHGNVWEWCHDYYTEDYYYDCEDVDPLNNQRATFRTNRGGSWDYYSSSCRSADRGMAASDYRGNRIGFRAVLVQTR